MRGIVWRNESESKAIGKLKTNILATRLLCRLLIQRNAGWGKNENMLTSKSLITKLNRTVMWR
ncbi:hypothetical protein CUN67_29410 (plasmid) [Pantoea cypripedii]|uniref:Uncharacterized protein n=1 Tax=Pantoea cypripedii TaxID=55209 RepID=A0A6B9GFC4_PANCY|nr:hypothetical protein CUN67_29410 [Pantoea cypripedii]